MRAAIGSILLLGGLLPALTGSPAGAEFRSGRAGPADNSAVMAGAESAPAVLPVPAEPEETYAIWAGAYFSPAELADATVSGPDAARAEDGVTNVVKYALGFGPQDEVWAALGEADRLDGHVFFWYCRPADIADVEYRVEVSADGVNWTTEGVTQEPILVDDMAVSWQAHYHAAPWQTVFFRLNPSLR